MRNSKFSFAGKATLLALAIAGVLTIGAGTGAVAQTKPKVPPPAKPAANTATLVQKPVARAAQPVRPAVQPARPAVQPARPQSQPVRPQSQPVRPPVQPVRPPMQPVRPPNETVRPPAPSVNPVAPRPMAPRPMTPTKTPIVDRKTGKPVVERGDVVKPSGNGGQIIKKADNREIVTNSRGEAKAIRTPSGTEAHLNHGQITTMHKTGADGSTVDVHRSPAGVHTIKTVSRDPYGHSLRTVSDGHRGFRERELSRRPGYSQRTYFDHGHTYAVIYHTRVYGGYGAYPVYVPAYYYSPGYYAWFGSPWGAPVAYGWVATPGYGAYGGYFAPPPSYNSPNAWMADYIINANLQVNYSAQQDAQADAAADGTQAAADAQGGQPQPIPPAVRDAYVKEVQTSVQGVQAEATGQPAAEQVPGALSPAHKVFQSYSDVEATDPNGQECALTGGDFVQREEDTPDANKTVAVTVVAVAQPSAAHCAMNARVRLAVDTLQEWYNSFAEKEQAGFEAMAAGAGNSGLPGAPNPGKVANPMGQGTPDDANAMANAIQEQQTGATTMQAEVSGGGQ